MKKLALPVLTILLSTQLIAQSELKTKSISVFKNGKSFVVKEGEVSTTDNVYTLSTIPNALFGTLWFAGLQADVVQVTSKQEQVEESVERKASNFTDLLYANKGKRLTLTTTDDKTYTGTVEDFDLLENTSPILMIRTNDKWVSISPLSIKTIEFSDKPEKVAKVNTKVMKPLVKIQFTKGGKQSLSMMYLQNGISWLPTYLLELISDTEARLRLQAEVTNDSEDIVNTSMNFVVGVPNFKFANNAATLTSFVEGLRRDIDYLDYGRSKGNIFSNALMSQVAGLSYADEATESPAAMENVDADASEDFYFYNVNNVTLEQGARAHYPLFNTSIKIKHLYECNLSAMQKEQNYRNYDDESQLSFDIKRCNVFHSIEIKNNTKNPFTTGSVMIIDAKTQRPLSEDLIKYTGSGQSSSIQLTQSPDVRVEEQEKIIRTEKNAKKRYSYNYNLLTIQSEVTIINSKKKDIEMAISKLITGKSKTASINYDSKQTPAGSSNINPQDKLKFNLNVKAGQTLKFTYTYEMYVQD